MTNQEVIEILLNEQKCLDRNDGVQCDRKCESCDLVMDAETIREAYSMAISALQEQDSKTRKICNTCKHDPPSKKWPCVDCDMREPADRWESKECQTCKHYDDASKKCGECLELGIDNYEPKEMENSKELSKTQKALDTISRQEAIDALMDEFKRVPTTAIRAKNLIDRLPSAQPNNQVNLCDSCKYLYPDCPSEADDVIFGNGKGNDNICACNKYLPSAQPSSGSCWGCQCEKMEKLQPERKTGRWLIRKGISDAQCSECKMYFSDVYDVENSDAFCRHCGAKMEGLKVVKHEGSD